MKGKASLFLREGTGDEVITGRVYATTDKDWRTDVAVNLASINQRIEDGKATTDYNPFRLCSIPALRPAAVAVMVGIDEEIDLSRFKGDRNARPWETLALMSPELAFMCKNKTRLKAGEALIFSGCRQSVGWKDSASRTECMYNQAETCVSAPRSIIFFAVPNMQGKSSYTGKEVEETCMGINAMWAAAEEEDVDELHIELGWMNDLAHNRPMMTILSMAGQGACSPQLYFHSYISRGICGWNPVDLTKQSWTWMQTWQKAIVKKVEENKKVEGEDKERCTVWKDVIQVITEQGAPTSHSDKDIDRGMGHLVNGCWNADGNGDWTIYKEQAEKTRNQGHTQERGGISAGPNPLSFCEQGQAGENETFMARSKNSKPQKLRKVEKTPGAQTRPG